MIPPKKISIEDHRDWQHSLLTPADEDDIFEVDQVKTSEALEAIESITTNSQPGNFKP